MKAAEAIARLRAGKTIWLASLSVVGKLPCLSDYVEYRFDAETAVYVRTATAKTAFIRKNGIGRFDDESGRRYLVWDSDSSGVSVSTAGDGSVSLRHTGFFSPEDLIRTVRILALTRNDPNAEGRMAEFRLWLDCEGLG